MKKVLSTLVVVLSAVGAINWGLVGGFNFDLVAAIFGPMSTLSRVVYVLVGISGLLLLVGGIKCISKWDGTQCNSTMN